MLETLRERREQLEQLERERSPSKQFFWQALWKEGLNCFSLLLSRTHRRANTGEVSSIRSHVVRVSNYMQNKAASVTLLDGLALVLLAWRAGHVAIVVKPSQNMQNLRRWNYFV